MFNEIRRGPPKRTIALTTKKGTALSAEIGAQASDNDKLKFQRLTSKHTDWKIRTGATGGYNCAGMVWATRRANLCEPSEWKKILKEDGYREIKKKHARVGDIAVYVRDIDSEISHVGRICQIEYLKIVDTMDVPLPKVLSKMGATFGECIHSLCDIDLDGGVDFNVKIFTDRLNEPDIKQFDFILR